MRINQRGEVMAMASSFIDELTREAATTKRVLERVPQDKLAWRPHPKSWSLGELALHIAQVPGAIADLITPSEREPSKFTQKEAQSSAEIIQAFDASVANAKAKLGGWDDAALMSEWKLKSGSQTILAMPRIAMVRSIMLNHWYHHRGQLAVYLRLLDVSVPSIYGPSADENPFM
jgi:uncharacterized damage-inducible protein DinB